MERSAEYVTVPTLAAVIKRLDNQSTWATSMERFKAAHTVEINGINTELVKLNDALARLHAEPPVAVGELVTRLEGLVAQLTAAREQELQARQELNEAKETLELTTAFALSSANGAVDGKNEEQRKTAKAVYLAGHAEVRAAQAALDAAQLQSEQAQVDLRCAEDAFSATRATASLMAAQLNYLSGRG